MANAYTLVGGLGTTYDGSYVLTPTTSDIIIPDNTVFRSNLTVKGDSNLISANIIAGNSIFGVEGTKTPVEYEGDIGVGYIGDEANYIRYKMISITYK